MKKKTKCGTVKRVKLAATRRKMVKTIQLYYYHFQILQLPLYGVGSFGRNDQPKQPYFASNSSKSR